MAHPQRLKAKEQLTDTGIPFKFLRYDDGHVIYPKLIELLNGLYE